MKDRTLLRWDKARIPFTISGRIGSPSTFSGCGRCSTPAISADAGFVPSVVPETDPPDLFEACQDIF